MRWLFNRRAGAVAERARPERDRTKSDRVEWLEPQAAYSLWAKTYPPRPHNPLMELEQQTVYSLLPEVKGLTVLDAGCGTGRYLQALERRGAFAIGMDLSAAMLAHARGLSHRVAQADLRAMPFDDRTIDMVVCGLALGDIAELELALHEIARVLRPGGSVIYSVVHPAGESAGWSRTFESDGRQVAIDGFWHTLDHHRRACAAAGLTIDEWREPELAEVPGQRALLIVRARR
jgi:malonyl-CoA O-methyltransferase